MRYCPESNQTIEQKKTGNNLTMGDIDIAKRIGRTPTESERKGQEENDEDEMEAKILK